MDKNLWTLCYVHYKYRTPPLLEIEFQIYEPRYLTSKKNKDNPVLNIKWGYPYLH